MITDTCTTDELWVEACPMDCIHPKKDEPRFEELPQLYVDPVACIDCGMPAARPPALPSLFRVEDLNFA